MPKARKIKKYLERAAATFWEQSIPQEGEETKWGKIISAESDRRLRGSVSQTEPRYKKRQSA